MSTITTEHQTGDLSRLTNADFAEFFGRVGSLALAFPEGDLAAPARKRRAIADHDGGGGPVPLVDLPEAVSLLPAIVRHHVEAG